VGRGFVGGGFVGRGFVGRGFVCRKFVARGFVGRGFVGRWFVVVCSGHLKSVLEGSGPQTIIFEYKLLFKLGSKLTAYLF
jgi:hypothetical protein